MLRSEYLKLMIVTALLLCLINPWPISAAEDESGIAPAQLQVLAAESGDDYNEMTAPPGVVAPDRIWRVRFSQSVDIDSVKIQNIYISQNGVSIPGITVEMDSYDNRVIEVRPPANGYTPGDYELFITPGLFSSQTGKALNQGVKMKFTVAAPLSIGAILPISSLEGDCGVQQQRGMELAVKYINAQGGINGQPLQIIYKDDTGDSALAQSAFQELSSQGVPLILGLPFNHCALAVAPLAEQQQLPIILSTASDVNLANYKDYVFKLSPSTEYEALALNETLKDRDWNRVAVIYNDSDYGRDLMEEFSQDYAGCDRQIVAALSCSVGATDFESQMATIAELSAGSDDPLTIVFIGHAADLINAWYAAYEMGISANWLGANETVKMKYPR